MVGGGGGGGRNGGIDADGVLRADAPGDGRPDVSGVYHLLAVEYGIGIGGQGAPVGDRGVPGGATRGVAAAVQVGVGAVIGGDQAHLGAELDRQVAQGEPLLDRHGADGGAGVLHGIAGAGLGAERADGV